jgi:hypothetical protein
MTGQHVSQLDFALQNIFILHCFVSSFVANAVIGAAVQLARFSKSRALLIYSSVKGKHILRKAKPAHVFLISTLQPLQ